MNIAFTIGPEIITSYRRLDYTPWHAFAEFVDNSTQSFFNNEVVLKKASLDETRPLTVEIEYEPENDIIRITDNAMGMSDEELTEALHLANPPANTSGRSRYGLGMKTAACWLGNLWTVRTKKLGESKEHSITVDVDQIAAGNNDLNYISKEGVEQEEHYTIVEIRKHNQRFKGRTLGKIKQYLSSMYRQDFRDDTLNLIWRNEPLEWVELDERLLKDRNGNLYKKEFEFSFVDDFDGEDKFVKGWVGVMHKGSRSNAGFSILHSNRVVKGWPDSWRPSVLYGQEQGSNDLVNQRLVGEIHLDDFEVTHTKDNIQWLGDQDEKVEQGLLEHCAEYREVARTYRKGTGQIDQRAPSEIETATAISELEAELSSPELEDIIIEDPLLPEVLVEEATKSVKEAILNENHEEKLRANIGGILVRLFVEHDMSPNDPYLTVESAIADEVIIIVNAAHPHWNQLRGARGVLNYLRHCTYDGISEWQARQKTSRLDPDTIKILKDRLLRLYLEIEKHAYDEDEEEDLI